MDRHVEASCQLLRNIAQCKTSRSQAQEKYEYRSTATFASAAFWLLADVLRFNKPQYKVRDKLSVKYVHTSCLETVIK